ADDKPGGVGVQHRASPAQTNEGFGDEEGQPGDGVQADAGRGEEVEEADSGGKNPATAGRLQVRGRRIERQGTQRQDRRLTHPQNTTFDNSSSELRRALDTV